MKVGGDAVLLAAATPATATPDQILDIGTGTGVLALLLAQRCPAARLTAVEIDPTAATQARENVAASPYAERIEVYTGAIQEADLPERSYERIVCNPPFFTGGVMSEVMPRRDARHTTRLSHADLLRSVKRLLAPEGTFSLILPKLEALRFQELAQQVGLSLRTQLRLRPRTGEGTKRIVMTLGRRATETPQITEIVQYRAGQEWTAEYRALVGPCYRQDYLEGGGATQKSGA